MIQRVRLILAAVLGLQLIIAFLAVDAGKARQDIAAAKAAGERPGWEDLADTGIQLGALAGAGLSVLLIALAPLWLRAFKTEPPDVDGTLVREAPPRWRKWAWMIAPLVVAVWYGNMSFAGKSLWWDELWQVENASLGAWKQGKDDSLKFTPSSWKKCAFYYLKPTNHVPMALLQKASFTLSNAISAKPAGVFSDLTARLPALLASGTAVVLAFRYIGHLGGVSIMALLLMLHPWHLRYGVETRAYALLVPLCFSAMLACRKVVITQARDWRYLSWLGLNQAVWIWAFPFKVIDVGLMFFVVAWLLAREHKRNSKDKLTAWIRLAVVHACAAALVVQLFLPCVLQVGKDSSVPQHISFSLLQETASQLAFGMSFSESGGMDTQHLASSVKVFGSDTMARGAALLVLCLALVGIRSLMQRMPRMGLITACPLIAGILFMLLCWKAHLYYYPRFVITLLPMLVIGLSEVPGLFADYAQNRRKIAFVLLGLFAWFTLDQRAVLRTVPYTGWRDAAAFLQEQGEPTPITKVLGLGREVLPVYLPQAGYVLTGDDMLAALKQAKQEKRRLYIVQGYSSFHSSMLPEAMKFLRTSGLFKEVKSWPGLEGNFYLRVWQANE
jgi:hypothetical protein